MKIKKDKNDKSVDVIARANRRAAFVVVLSAVFGLFIAGFTFYYFFQSDLKDSKKRDEELYFSVLFIDDNDIPYGAYVGVVSSLHNRIGIIGLPRNIALWRDKREESVPLNILYERGGENEVFKAVETSIQKKITYKMTLNGWQLSDIIDLIGGIRMYIE